MAKVTRAEAAPRTAAEALVAERLVKIELWTEGMFKYVATVEVPGERPAWHLLFDEENVSRVVFLPQLLEWHGRYFALSTGSYFALSTGSSNGLYVYTEQTFVSLGFADAHA